MKTTVTTNQEMETIQVLEGRLAMAKRYKMSTIIFNVIYALVLVIGLSVIVISIDSYLFGGAPMERVAMYKYIAIGIMFVMVVIKTSAFNTPVGRIVKRIEYLNDRILKLNTDQQGY